MAVTTYRDHLIGAMSLLASKPKTLVVGYGVSAGGTTDPFPSDRRIEMPLAEALCAGVSIGLSLKGFVPIQWVERMDFSLICLDQWVNHLSKLESISGGIHKPAVIIRVCVGNRQTPLFTGPTHCQDFSKALAELISFPVIRLMWISSIIPEYEKAYKRALEGESTMLIEFKDLYGT